MPAFDNPVAGLIHPKGWVRPAGSVEFVVIRTAADHLAVGQGHANDIGAGKCGLPVFAMKAGRVYFRQDFQGILRVQCDDGPLAKDAAGVKVGYAYAHMRQISVKVGDRVFEGQRVGVESDAHDPAIKNFSGCHLHFAAIIDGAEVDPEPLLRQNGATDEETDVLKGTNPVRISNRQTTVLGDNTNLRPSPGTAEPEVAKMAAGQVFLPDWSVTGGLALGSTTWYAGWYNTTFGYLSEKVLAPLTPIESTGYTKAQLKATANEVAKAAVDAAAQV